MSETNFNCGGCGYKFTKKLITGTVVCPYCGSKNVGQYKPTTAQDLLNDLVE